MIRVLPLADFLAERLGQVEPLLGTRDDAILPGGGLLLLGGREGVGKSTAALDLAFHAASGLPWLGLPVRSPLRVLVLENEGPREPFRRKLERKAAAWSSPVPGAILVSADPWGAVSLAPASSGVEIRDCIAAHEIDLVIADPLGSLGIEGNGTPAETRAFVADLRRAGLLDRAGWVFVHHLNRDATADDLGAISGAWGQHADAVLTLRDEPGDRARLAFAKLRWGEPRAPLVLDRDRERATFTVTSKRSGRTDGDLDAAILAFVEANPGATGKAIRGAVAARDGETIAALRRLRASGVLRSEKGARNSELWFAAGDLCPAPGHCSEQVVSSGVGVVPQPPTTPVGGGAAGTASRPPVPDLEWDEDDAVAADLDYYRSKLATSRPSPDFREPMQ